MSYFDRTAFRVGCLAAVIVMLLIYAGSRELKYFDWALTTYAVGSIFAAFAVVYRYAVWAQRPPTMMYLKRGWKMFIRPRRNAPSLGKRLLDDFVLQKFITERSKERWIMHACLSWGAMLAFALTFPLVFGWIHFETLAHNAEIYRVFVLGVPVEEFSVHGLRGFLHFNLLNISAVVMLVNHLAEWDQELPAGSLVLSGGVTEAIQVKRGDAVNLRMQHLDSVGCRFV